VKKIIVLTSVPVQQIIVLTSVPVKQIIVLTSVPVQQIIVLTSVPVQQILATHFLQSDDTRGCICTICVVELLMMGGMRSKHVEELNLL
jgi:hypothetical protein